MMRSLVCALLVVGCGGIDIRDFQSEALDARCEYLTNCGLFENVAACKEQLADPQSTSIVAAVEAGKVKYDEDLAEDCIEALRDASCSQSAQLDPKCDDIFAGTIADGGMCAFDDECVSGSCAVSDCTEACCPGVCQPSRPRPKLGEMCNFICDDGLYCGTDNTCHKVLAAGAACDSPVACADGLYCAGFTGMTAGTCTKLPATGEACTEQCLDIGDYCDGTCKPVGLPGDTCANNDACSYYYFCDDTMHCAEEPPPMLMPDGSTCSSSVQCESRYCGNDNKCGPVPECI